ncbi:MAG: cytochrome b/b6 domain-containing protein [Burkholderiaceae bacterium]
MNTSTSLPLGQPAPRPAGRLVTDAPTRLFHWLFALSFAGAYLTAESEHWRLVHVTLGYIFAGLAGFRIAYGLLGPRHVRLSVLWRKLTALPSWLQSMKSARVLSAAHWRQGQNLAMALAIAAMLALVLPLALSGYATYNDWGDFLGGDWPEELHELIGNAFLALVLAHMGMLALTSLLRRQNQALPMLTGRVSGPGPDLVKHRHNGLAALLLVAVVAFGVWQWQTAPAPLPDEAGATWSASGRSHTDDHDDD